MENQVWEKAALFLKELRCEDIRRNSIIHLDSCQREREKLRILRKMWEKDETDLSELQRKAVSSYIEQIQTVSFEEQQEAYCQGIIDCVQVLSGLGLLKTDRKIEQVIKKLK